MTSPFAGAAGKGRADANATRTAALLPVLGAGVTFALVGAGRPFYFGDFQGAFEPLRTLTGRAWREGLPLWSSALGNGIPLLASPFVGVLYPPNLVFALLRSNTALALSVLVVLHVVFGAWGAARLARRLGQTGAGSAAAALTFALAGATVSGTYMVVLLCTAAWLPWLLLAFGRARDARPYSGLVLGATFGMTLLAGDPTMILAGGIGGMCLFLPPGLHVSAAKKIAVGLALGAALASPVLVALARYVPASVRAGGFPAELRLLRSLHPLEAVGFAVPDPFGSRTLPGPEGTLVPGRAGGNGTPLFHGLYVGALALALAGLGAVRSPLRARFVLWGLCLALLALGRYGPFALVSGLPGFDVLRFPSKWILPAMLPFALLVGAGVSAFEERGDAGTDRAPSGFLAAALLALSALSALAALGNLGVTRALAAAATASPDALLRAADSIRGHLLEGTARAALPVLAALAVVRFARASAPWLLGVLLAADLSLANRALAPTAPASFYAHTPAAIRAVEADPQGHARVWVDHGPAARAVPSRVAGEIADVDAALFRRRERLDAYAAASYGVPLAFPVDLEALSTVRYARLAGLVDALPARSRITLLGLAGASHLVTPAALEDERLEELASLDVGADRPLRVYRNRAAVPRARVVKIVVPVPPGGLDTAAAKIEDGFFGSRTLVDERDLPAISAAWHARGVLGAAGSARIESDLGSRVVIEVSGGGGFLVLTDCLAPGWRAAVDGTATPIFPADVAFRMVVVPPGAREVVFTYDPWRS